MFGCALPKPAEISDMVLLFAKYDRDNFFIDLPFVFDFVKQSQQQSSLACAPRPLDNVMLNRT